MFASRFAKLAAVVALVPTTSCYFFYPHDIVRQTAPHAGSAGAQIELAEKNGMSYFECRKRDTCVVHDGELRRESPYTITSALYDGKELTRGEVAELVAPEQQPKRWAAMQKNERTCSLSAIPSYAFAGGALVDMFGAAAVSQTSSKIPVYLLVGGAAVMLLGAALSYPMGGFACTHAKAVAETTGIIKDAQKGWITYAEDEGDVEREHELHAQVDAFNARGGGGDAKPAEPPASDEGSGSDDGAATDEAPAGPLGAPTKFAGNLRAALGERPELSTFLRLVAIAKVDELSGDNRFTVFAPTNAALAASGFDVKKLLATKGSRDRDKLRDIVRAFIVQKVEPLDATVARGSTSNRSGSHLAFARAGGGVTVEGYPLVGAPVIADNGAIYELGPKP